VLKKEITDVPPFSPFQAQNIATVKKLKNSEMEI